MPSFLQIKCIVLLLVLVLVEQILKMKYFVLSSNKTFCKIGWRKKLSKANVNNVRSGHMTAKDIMFLCSLMPWHKRRLNNDGENGRRDEEIIC